MNSVCPVILLTFLLTLSFGDAFLASLEPSSAETTWDISKKCAPGLWCAIKKREEDLVPEQNPPSPDQNPPLPEQNPPLPEQNPSLPEQTFTASERMSTAPGFQCYPGLDCRRTSSSSRGSKPPTSGYKQRFWCVTNFIEKNNKWQKKIWCKE